MPASEGGIPQQRDVVVLPFPYADRLAEKRRPAAVVSLPHMAEENGIVWVVMITSAANAGWTSDVRISDLAAAGLTNPSVVRPAKIATIDVARITRIAGHLAAPDTKALARMLKTFTGL